MPTSRLCGGGADHLGVAEANAAVVGPDKAGEHHQQRRLARAGRPEQCQELAAADVEVDVIERADQAVGLGKPPHA